MSHTEEEARKKWCPQSFAIQPVVNEYGAEIQSSGPWTCKASECMAWRKGEPERITDKIYHDTPAHRESVQWINSERVVKFGGHRWQYAHTDADDLGKFDLVHRPADCAAQTGYCGLAGKE